MKNKEMDFISQEGEGLKIEFKENFNKFISREIVAFANAVGGRIFLGVSDDGSIKGIEMTNGLKSQIQDLVNICDPVVKINIENSGTQGVSSDDLDIINEGKNIVVIEVEEGVDKPYKCPAGFFMRQGANSQKMTRDEIGGFFNKEGKILFDEQINEKFNFENGFNENKFDSFLRKSKLSRVLSMWTMFENL